MKRLILFLLILTASYAIGFIIPYKILERAASKRAAAAKSVAKGVVLNYSFLNNFLNKVILKFSTNAHVITSFNNCN